MNPIHPTVVWLTWRQVFANRRLYFAVVFALAPLLVALGFRALAVNPAAEGYAFYLLLQREIALGILLPLTALVIGTTAFGGELDDGTLLYMLVKPVARWRVVTSKYFVAAASTFVLMVPGVLLPWFAIRSDPLTFGVALSFVWGMALGALLYAAFFTMLGLVHKQSLVLGLFYVVVFEAVLLRRLPGMRVFSIREFANAASLTMADPALNLGAPALGTGTLLYGGGGILVAALAFAAWKLARFEVSEKL
jgi:ABC-2 type transport system permease protein